MDSPAPSIVRELTRSGSGARQCLVRMGENHYVVSSVTAFDTDQFETLVFPANSDGEITSWGEIAGGRGMSRSDAIADLARHGEQDHPAMADIIDTVGGPLAFMASTLAGEAQRAMGTLLVDKNDRI